MTSQYPPGEHPVERGTYVLVTPMAKAFLEFTRRMLGSNIPGFAVLGPSRVGKTWLLLYLRAVLGIPVIIVLGHKRQKDPSMNASYEMQLESLNHDIAELTKDRGKRRRFIEYVGAEVVKSGQNRVVICIDDIHKVSEEQLQYLMSEFNYFEQIRRIRPLYIFTAPPKHLLSILELGQKDAEGGEYRRFYTMTYSVVGVGSLGDMRAVMRTFDENSVFPRNSNTAFSEYFFTKAFAGGWRFANDAELVFDGFQRLQNRFALSDQQRNIGMQYVTGTLNQLLVDFRSHEHLAPQYQLEDVVLRILYTGYISAHLPGRHEDIAQQIANPLKGL